MSRGEGADYHRATALHRSLHGRSVESMAWEDFLGSIMRGFQTGYQGAYRIVRTGEALGLWRREKEEETKKTTVVVQAPR